MSKVCVAIFVFLSGYGLYKSFSRYCQSGNSTFKNCAKYTFSHIKNLLFQYWWAVVPFAIFGMVSGLRTFKAVYGTGSIGILYFVVDLFGLGGRFDMSHMYNITCWYIALAIGLYLLFPLLYHALKTNPILFVGINLLLAFLPFPALVLTDRIWLFVFMLGMIFAKYSLLDILMFKMNENVSFIGAALAFIATALIRHKYDLPADGLFSVGIIVFVVALVSKISVVGTIFEFIGKHSANIFMVHTFFYEYFWTDIIYAPRYPVIIFLFLLTVCLGYSMLLEKIKSVVGKLFFKIKKTVLKNAQS